LRVSIETYFDYVAELEDTTTHEHHRRQRSDRLRVRLRR
jgi:hypothetical protein